MVIDFSSESSAGKIRASNSDPLANRDILRFVGGLQVFFLRYSYYPSTKESNDWLFILEYILAYFNFGLLFFKVTLRWHWIRSKYEGPFLVSWSFHQFDQTVHRGIQWFLFIREFVVNGWHLPGIIKLNLINLFFIFKFVRSYDKNSISLSLIYIFIKPNVLCFVINLRNTC
jgi:hypothetical protein